MLRALLCLATVSWALLIASVAFFIYQGTEADTAIRVGIANAARVGCIENNARWQLVVSFSEQKRPNRKRTKAEQKVIDQLTNRDCDRVAARLLARTAP